MSVTGNPLVVVILAVPFVAVGVYLFVWSRRQSRSIERFAESRGLVYRPGDIEGLEAQVNDCVALEEPKLTRTFSQFGDIVALGRGALFRAVELLDLNPYGRAEYVNRSRVAVSFAYRCPVAGIFSVSPEYQVYQRYPESPSGVDRVHALLQAARVASPPCPLSLTIMRGRVVAYLEPTVTGAVSRKHLDYLVELAGRLVAADR